MIDDDIVLQEPTYTVIPTEYVFNCADLLGYAMEVTKTENDKGMSRNL